MSDWTPNSVNIEPSKYGAPFQFRSLDHLTANDPVYFACSEGGFQRVSFLKLGRVVKTSEHRVTVQGVHAKEWVYERTSGRTRGNAPALAPVLLENKSWSDSQLRRFLIQQIKSNLSHGFGRKEFSDEQCLEVAKILKLTSPKTEWPQ